MRATWAAELQGPRIRRGAASGRQSEADRRQEARPRGEQRDAEAGETEGRALPRLEGVVPAREDAAHDPRRDLLSAQGKRRARSIFRTVITRGHPDPRERSALRRPPPSTPRRAGRRRVPRAPPHAAAKGANRRAGARGDARRPLPPTTEPLGRRAAAHPLVSFALESPPWKLICIWCRMPSVNPCLLAQLDACLNAMAVPPGEGEAGPGGRRERARRPHSGEGTPPPARRPRGPSPESRPAGAGAEEARRQQGGGRGRLWGGAARAWVEALEALLGPHRLDAVAHAHAAGGSDGRRHEEGARAHGDSLRGERREMSEASFAARKGAHSTV